MAANDDLIRIVSRLRRLTCDAGERKVNASNRHAEARALGEMGAYIQALEVLAEVHGELPPGIGEHSSRYDSKAGLKEVIRFISRKQDSDRLGFVA